MLRYKIASPDELSPEQISELFNLMKIHYRNVDFQRFQRDLQEKTGIILLVNEQGLIRGFSTYLIYDIQDLGAKVIFSGDTVIHKESWGDVTLFYGFGSILNTMIQSKKEGEKLYWFLISKGIRTYGMLPLFFFRFWPQPKEGQTSPEELVHLKEILDKIAHRKFGTTYDAKRGVLPIREDYLDANLAEIPKHKQKDPYIRCFLERNPGYRKGEELACLTEVSLENLRPRARRFVTRENRNLQSNI